MTDHTHTAAGVATAAGGALAGIAVDALLGGLGGAFVAQAFSPPSPEKASLLNAALVMCGSVVAAGIFAPLGAVLLPSVFDSLSDVQRNLVVGGVIGALGPAFLTLLKQKFGGAVS